MSWERFSLEFVLESARTAPCWGPRVLCSTCSEGRRDRREVRGVPPGLTSCSAFQFGEKSSGAFGGRTTTSLGSFSGFWLTFRLFLPPNLLFFFRTTFLTSAGSAPGEPGARLGVSAFAFAIPAPARVLGLPALLRGPPAAPQARPTG